MRREGHRGSRMVVETIEAVGLIANKCHEPRPAHLFPKDAHRSYISVPRCRSACRLWRRVRLLVLIRRIPIRHKTMNRARSA